MPASNGVPLLNGANAEACRMTKAVSKATATREMRALQELIHTEAKTGKPSKSQLCALACTYVKLREAIRIEKGLIKPGSRNESVRVEPAAKKRRQKPVMETIDGAAEALGIQSAA